MAENLQKFHIAAQYETLERKRRLYTGILLLLFVVFLIGGVRIAENANAGSIWSGLSRLLDYPAAIFEQAYARGWSFFVIPFQVQHADNGIKYTYLHYLIETINMAVVATDLRVCPGRGYRVFWPQAIW